MPLIILVTYFILYYLIPVYSRRPDKGKVFLWILAVLVFIGFGVRYYKFYILGPVIDPGQNIPADVWAFGRVLGDIWSALVVISLAVAIKLIKNKTQLQEKNAQLVTEKRMAELNFLKAQMHPHFLFNTLNTLYSETIQESGKAQEVVLHLSSLLRFILEECNRPLIPVGHEIKVIRDFIALEQLRHGNRLQVNLSVSDIDVHQQISPLIFLPFVENSFKHTLNNKRGTIQIDVTITMKGSHFSLKVENDKGELFRQVNGHLHGMGTANITRQLELLYGKDYTLHVDDLPQKYIVSLTVPAKP
jgi:LytS/YehU family sensor histidine kinase